MMMLGHHHQVGKVLARGCQNRQLSSAAVDLLPERVAARPLQHPPYDPRRMNCAAVVPASLQPSLTTDQPTCAAHMQRPAELTRRQRRRRPRTPSALPDKSRADATTSQDQQQGVCTTSIPVTMLSGMKGAGKSTLIRHVLSRSSEFGDSEQRRIGVLMFESAGAGGSSGTSSSTSRRHLPTEPDGAEGPNCSEHSFLHSTRSQDVETGLSELEQLAAASGVHCGCFVIECPGTSAPLTMAMQLEEALERQQEGAHRAFTPVLDTLVTVVDAQGFLPGIRASEYLADLGLAEDELDDRTVADALVEQVEYANVLVMNKGDLVSEAQAQQLELVLRKLNPSAQVVLAENGRVPADQVLHTGKFDLEGVAQAPGWLSEMNAYFQGEQAQLKGGPQLLQEEAEHGIQSFVYYAQRPFHPQRLLDQALSTEWKGVLRSKGYFWLASRHNVMGAWQSAGAAWQGEPNAFWEVAQLPEERGAAGAVTLQPWHEQWGDRCQLIWWLGINMDEQSLRAMLDGCLLSDKEMEGGPDAWSRLEDPLPSWDEVHDSDEDSDED